MYSDVTILIVALVLLVFSLIVFAELPKNPDFVGPVLGSGSNPSIAETLTALFSQDGTGQLGNFIIGLRVAVATVLTSIKDIDLINAKASISGLPAQARVTLSRIGKELGSVNPPTTEIKFTDSADKGLGDITLFGSGYVDISEVVVLNLDVKVGIISLVKGELYVPVSWRGSVKDIKASVNVFSKKGNITVPDTSVTLGVPTIGKIDRNFDKNSTNVVDFFNSLLADKAVKALYNAEFSKQLNSQSENIEDAIRSGIGGDFTF